MKSIISLAIGLFISLLFSYKATAQNTSDVIPVDIDMNTTYQTIHNFGASDAWSCQFVGNWPDDKKNRIADLLFSTDKKADGSPKGIGLSCWRFNIGGGSADQEGETKIGDPWRRAECFLQKDGSYNWQKQAGQRWFLRAAKERGVEDFLAFVNSPPVWLTKNGRANSDGGNNTNLKKENFETFSRFLVDVTTNINKNDGVLFDYLSPINEPQWDWKGGQEGSPWTNREMAQFCRILGNDLEAAQLSTKISISEAGFLTHLFERGNDSKRGFQVQQFFSQDSENYIGDVPNMAHKISGHSYHTVKSDSIMHLVRSKLHKAILQVDPTLEFWMSEYCILGGNGTLKGGGRDLGMETALFVTNIIHADLTVANSSTWQWWLAVSPYNFKDGLVYIDKSETNGEIYESKLLWAFGNYSRFIRPGAKRINVQEPDNTDVRISAYKNLTGELVVVCINRATKTQNVQFNLSGKAKRFETSKEKNLELSGKVDLEQTIQLPAYSVTTFVAQ